MKIRTRSRISAVFLLAVMLSMIFGVSLHNHGEQASVTETCAECQHHVHHAGHLTVQSVDFHECPLCQLHSVPYLMPSILHLAVVSCFILSGYAILCERCINDIIAVYSPRAPPCPYSVS